MKKVFKLITLMLILFISIYFYNYNNSIVEIEIETEVKGKLSTLEEIKQALGMAGGEISSISFGNNNSDSSASFKAEDEYYGNETSGYHQGYWIGFTGHVDTDNKNSYITKVAFKLTNKETGEEKFFSFVAGETYNGILFPTTAKSVYISFNFGYVQGWHSAQAAGKFEIGGTMHYVNILGGNSDNASNGHDFKINSTPPYFKDGNKQPTYGGVYGDGKNLACISVMTAIPTTQSPEIERDNTQIFAYSCTKPDANGVCDDTHGSGITKVNNFGLQFSGTNTISACADESSLNKDLIYSVKLVLVDNNGNQNSSNFKQFSLEPYVTTALTSTQNTQTTSTTISTEKGTTLVDYTGDDRLADRFDFVIGSATLQCEGSGGIAELIDDFINIIFIVAPILTILMGTIEFVKPLLSKDADALQKASSDMIKRAIALVLLLFLKVILLTIFNFFGISLCI